MSIVGYRARNHPQQVARRGADNEVDNRATPLAEFKVFDERFSFSIDVAATAENKKCERFFGPADDGLTQSWTGERVWCNPPYSAIPAWMLKAWRSPSAELIVMLLPANRTEQPWWQLLVEPYRDRGHNFSVEFLPGRMRFSGVGISPSGRPPFGNCLLIWS